MLNNIKLLKECDTAEKLLDYINNPVKISTKHGRTYEIQVQDDDNLGTHLEKLHLRDIVKKLEKIKKPSDAKEIIQAIIKRIKQLDKEGNQQLEKEHWTVKVSTAFRRLFGNLGYSKSSHLNKIRKDVGLTKNEVKYEEKLIEKTEISSSRAFLSSNSDSEGLSGSKHSDVVSESEAFSDSIEESNNFQENAFGAREQNTFEDLQRNRYPRPELTDMHPPVGRMGLSENIDSSDTESDESVTEISTGNVSPVREADAQLVCPITLKPFKDPVMLLEDGFTYEREALKEHLASQPNTSPVTGEDLESITFFSNLTVRNNDFICPITQERFQEPFLCREDGRTYEKSAILGYYELKVREFAEEGQYPPFIIKSPVCGIILNSITLYPNKVLFTQGNIPVTQGPISLNIGRIIEKIIPLVKIPYLSGSYVNDGIIRALLPMYAFSKVYDEQQGWLNLIHARRRELGLNVDAYRGNWGPVLDLSGLDLSNMRIDNLFIKNTNLIGVNFENSILTKCTFYTCRFIQCNMRQTTFDDCKFEGKTSSFFRTNFDHARLKNSRLDLDLRVQGGLNCDTIEYS